tara:strand:+ start:3269 stop:4663 length:1395 start_codon:yes stop_codon:yes gene_type:complete
MYDKRENKTLYLIIFFVTLISGIFNSIYYFEDIDSLRFATGIKYGYDIVKMQPHFPGYPVFHFIASIIYFFTSNLGITFAIIGSLSIFIIIISIINMINSKSLFTNIVIALIILLNPLFSIMATRYMPDLLGVAICSIIFHFSFFSKYKNNQILGIFLCGILIGIRVSYFPLIIIPIIYSIRYSKNFFYSGVAFMVGIIIWLIPLIVHQGLESLYQAGYSHTIGHFTEYGGSILTEKNILLRLKSIFHTIWADGFGGYWKDRYMLTVLISISLLMIIKNSIFNYYKTKNQKIKIIIISVLVYCIWIFFFQNVIYKSRHILPIVLILIITMFNLMPVKKYKNQYVILIILWSILTVNLNLDHKEGTAIFKLKEDLQNKNPDYIIGNNLINYYMQRNGVKAKKDYINYLSLNDTIFKMSDQYQIIFIGDYNLSVDKLYKNNFKNKTFYHNPYMNRMWSEIPIFYNE